LEHKKLYFVINVAAEKTYTIYVDYMKSQLNEVVINNTVARIYSKSLFCKLSTVFAQYIFQ